MKRLLTIVIAALAFAPAARGQWVQTNGPYGGTVQALANYDSMLFAGTYRGVFRSSDHGSHWESASNGMTDNDIACLIIINRTIVAGTVNGNIFRSTDLGTTWTQSTGLSHVYSIYSFAVWGTEIFTAANGGFFVSTDDGSSWQLKKAPSINLLTSTGSILFATNGNDVLRSIDSGATWVRIDSTLPAFGLGVQAIAVMGTDLFLGTAVGIYVSTDSGIDWSKTSGFSAANVFAVIHGKIFAGCDAGIFVSTDDGANWRLSDSALICPSILSLLVAGGDIYAGTNGRGVFVSTDSGTSWKGANNGLINTCINTFLVNDTNLFAGSDAGIARTSDTGKSWVMSDSPLYGIDNFVQLGGYIIIPGNRNQLFASSDGGFKWVARGYIFVPLDVLFTNGSALLEGTWGQGIFVSTDTGISWKPANSPDTTITSFLGIDTSLFVSSGSYVSGRDGGIWRSSNKTLKWIRSDSGLPNTYVASMTVVGTHIFAGTGQGVYRSDNGGSRWIAVNNGLGNDLSTRAFAVAGTNVFAVTGSGIFLSTNDGQDWLSANAGLGAIATLTLTVYNSNLFAGTNGYGVWRRPLSDFGISSVSPQSPAVTQTISSFPNPFPDRTEISFSLQSPEFAEISIVNPLGAEVARLYSGELAAGNHSFSWDAAGTAPGNYWCIVRTSEGVQRVGLLRQ